MTSPTTARLGDLIKPVVSWNPTRSPDEQFDYIDLSSVDQDRKLVSGATRLLTKDAPSRARQLVSPGDVLVSTVRPNLNGVAVVPDTLENATASTGFTVLRPGSGLEGRYLFHWVRSPHFIDDMVRSATGASYPAVSDRIVKASMIPLPPLDEQRRIAAILDQADALRAKRREALGHLDDLTQSIFLDMFGNHLGSSDWPTLQLQQAVKSGTLVTYGIVQAGDEYPEGIPYIRTGDISNGKVDVARLRRTDPEIARRFDRSRVETGDIVMSIRATVGTTAMVPREIDGANLTQGTARIAPGVRTLGVYLLHYLRSLDVQRWIQRQVKGATFQEITLSRLRELAVAIPPLDQQERFALRVAAVDSLAAQSRAQVQALDSLFVSLQSRAFAGELRDGAAYAGQGFSR
jgi:type I restriction enzyme S subunit